MAKMELRQAAAQQETSDRRRSAHLAAMLPPVHYQLEFSAGGLSKPQLSLEPTCDHKRGEFYSPILAWCYLHHGDVVALMAAM